jgi:hypothetical protein
VDVGCDGIEEGASGQAEDALAKAQVRGSGWRVVGSRLDSQTIAELARPQVAGPRPTCLRGSPVVPSTAEAGNLIVGIYATTVSHVVADLRAACAAMAVTVSR